MEASSMKDIITWEEIGQIIQGHELAPHAQLLKIELANLVRKSESKQMDDSEVGLLLLIIGESMLAGPVEV